MPAFFEPYTQFLGTGEKNEAGETLQEFLEKYNAGKYPSPSNTVDSLIISYTGELEELKLLMIQRKNHPCIGYMALPGGFVDMKENLEDAAARELYEETGVKDIPCEFIGTYGDYMRDPRTRVITAAYLGLVPEGSIQPKAADDAADFGWFDISLTLVETGEVTEKGRKRRTEDYELVLTDGEKNRVVKARTKRSFFSEGYIRGQRTEVVASEGISADHAAIITDGILHVQSLRKN